MSEDKKGLGASPQTAKTAGAATGSGEVSQGPVQNTDRELWREREGDYYANSVHVTAHGGLGINVGGYVIVKPLSVWHELGKSNHGGLAAALEEALPAMELFYSFYGDDEHVSGVAEAVEFRKAMATVRAALAKTKHPVDEPADRRQTPALQTPSTEA